MPELHSFFAIAAAQYQRSLAAPLSLRRAWLALMLLDQLAELVFETHRPSPAKVRDADDLPAYRSLVMEACPALFAINETCAMRADSPKLVRVPVPIDTLGMTAMPVGEFMISLYNDQAAERLVLQSGSAHVLAHAVMAEALEWWQAELTRIGVTV